MPLFLALFYLFLLQKFAGCFIGVWGRLYESLAVVEAFFVFACFGGQLRRKRAAVFRHAHARQPFLPPRDV